MYTHHMSISFPFTNNFFTWDMVYVDGDILILGKQCTSTSDFVLTLVWFKLLLYHQFKKIILKIEINFTLQILQLLIEWLLVLELHEKLSPNLWEDGKISVPSCPGYTSESFFPVTPDINRYKLWST